MSFETHEVTNQPPPLVDYNPFTADRTLVAAVEREGAAFALAELSAFGARLGKAETIEQGELANRYGPVLRTVDRFGQRADRVEFHPAWHHMLELGVAAGLHAAPWGEARPGAHVARAAGVILQAQIEAGVQCPMTMTYGVVPALQRQPEIAAVWLPRLVTRRYDARFIPADGKTGALMGMGMTEKQGGSDLRSNATRARPEGAGGPGAAYRLTGHKWFFSAPMCDAFLVLAQAPGGLSCFFLPRFLPDGTLNAIRLQRLKEKLGNRSNASSEIELHDAYALMVGEEGRGIPNIIEMATYTRLDCGLGTTGLMRAAVSQAAHHARHRLAFQHRLIDQPLMANVIADLEIEVEAATVLVMRLARAFDRQDDPAEGALRRLLTPAVKYWICKRGPILAAEAMEVLGGNGYVEEGPMPRLYREMPVNSIWEGSGNVMCLDMLRALGRSPEGMEALAALVGAVRGRIPALDRAADALVAELRDPAGAEARARRVTERLALVVQGALLCRVGPDNVAEAFARSRLERDHGGVFGTLPHDVDLAGIAARAVPSSWTA
jgi:putative acyl-CoA dehydrogenase